MDDTPDYEPYETNYRASARAATKAAEECTNVILTTPVDVYAHKFVQDALLQNAEQCHSPQVAQNIMARAVIAWKEFVAWQRDQARLAEGIEMATETKTPSVAEKPRARKKRGQP